MVTPTDDFGQFFLAVRKEALEIYPRDRILGVSFWLNGGASPIATSDLAVGAAGENDHRQVLKLRIGRQLLQERHPIISGMLRSVITRSIGFVASCSKAPSP
jgi:hypothetical protein